MYGCSSTTFNPELLFAVLSQQIDESCSTIYYTNLLAMLSSSSDNNINVATETAYPPPRTSHSRKLLATSNVPVIYQLI